MRQKDLVILAAGIGSRFKGNIKQFQSVGPAGECIMDYSIYDAVHAGFTRIVFIIRRDIETLFEEQIGKRVRHFCQSYGVEVICVFQEKEKLPDGYRSPATREKPWGTGHALLCCRGALQGKFVVINADDFYGREAFLQMAKFLDSLDDKCTGLYALAGFRLSNTLSSHGGVTRGLCKIDSEDMLISIQETKNIYKDIQGPYIETDEEKHYIDGGTPVSMNMWAFTSDVLDRLEKSFAEFLSNGGLQEPALEFLLPTEIGSMLQEGVQVKILPILTKWFGMTFREEAIIVREILGQMAQEGVYPSPLF